MSQRPLNRILLVDDDPDIRALVSAALGGMAGYTVESCCSAGEALSAARTFTPDLILLDVMMPESDGVSALKALREMAGTSSTPVVFMTASAQPQDLARYDALGCLGVIRKPFNPIALPQTLESLWQPRAPLAARAAVADFEALRRDYVAEMPSRLADLQKAADDVTSGGWDKGTLETLFQHVHRLAGSAGLYGLSELSRTAVLLEQILRRLLDGATWPPASDPAELGTLVKAVRRVARLATRPPRPPAEPSPISPR